MCPIPDNGISIISIIDEILDHVSCLFGSGSIQFAKPSKLKIDLTIRHQTLGNHRSCIVNAWGNDGGNVVNSTNRFGRVGYGNLKVMVVSKSIVGIFRLCKSQVIYHLDIGFMGYLFDNPTVTSRTS